MSKFLIATHHNLIDSGAARNVIDWEYIKILNIYHNPCQPPVHVKTLDDKPLRSYWASLGWLANCKIQIRFFKFLLACSGCLNSLSDVYMFLGTVKYTIHRIWSCATDLLSVSILKYFLCYVKNRYLCTCQHCLICVERLFLYKEYYPSKAIIM